MDTILASKERSERIEQFEKEGLDYGDYDPEFVEMVCEHAQTELTRWMREKNLPENIIQLVENISFMGMAAERARNKEAEPVTLAMLAQILVDTSRLVTEIGGAWR